MSRSIIPIHRLLPEEFLFIKKIEDVSDSTLMGLHSHNFYEILWLVRAGEKEFISIDFEDYELKQDQIYILSPGQIHSMDARDKEGFVISIASDFFNAVCPNNYRFLKYPYFFQESVDSSLSQNLTKLLDLILSEYYGQGRSLLLEAYMSAFVIQISSLDQNQANTSNKQDKALTILNLIGQSFLKQQEVVFYANAANLSIRRCNELMIQFTQKTIKQHIIERIITESKRLIATSSLSIKSISEALEFNDPAYFTRIFKKHTGKTPEQFRKFTLN